MLFADPTRTMRVTIGTRVFVAEVEAQIHVVIRKMSPVREMLAAELNGNTVG